MAEASTCTKKRYAVVTGSNKGIGFEICRELASNGVTVVLTARDEKKGTEAMEKLNSSGLSPHVMFHQLDVTNQSSIASLVDFVTTQFGVLDILVNNAGILGVTANWEVIEPVLIYGTKPDTKLELLKHTDGTPEECLETNYYGTKRMVEAFLPLLLLSDSPRIVNVSSSAGQLENIPNEEIKEILKNAENLTEEKVDELLSDFLKDFKEGLLETKGWPTFLSAYTMSKAAMNAYTRILAKRYKNFLINCVCPGYVKTDINDNTGVSTAREGAERTVKLALLPDNGPSGFFFRRNEVTSF